MDPDTVRDDIPVLDREVGGQPLVYFDNAATSLTPRQVVDAVDQYYTAHNANAHRGVHTLAAEATERYDDAHRTVAGFVNAEDWREVVFTRNATEALNAAAAMLEPRIDSDDTILLTGSEHHANLLPWRRVAERTGAELRFVAVDDDGRVDPADWAAACDDSVAVAAATHVSNVLGHVNPISAMAEEAHAHDAVMVVDAAQSVPHIPVDVQELGVDMLAWAGHKMLGPTGIGVLWGRRELLEECDPFLRGGGMVTAVTRDGLTYNDLPWKHEAGTPPIAQASGLAAAVDYLEELGMAAVAEHGRALGTMLDARLREMDAVTVLGGADRLGLVTFTVDGAHPHDVATVLDQHGVAVRAGKHCAHPLLDELGVDATVRASTYVYNTDAEVDRCIAALEEAVEAFT